MKSISWLGFAPKDGCCIFYNLGKYIYVVNSSFTNTCCLRQSRIHILHYTTLIQITKSTGDRVCCKPFSVGNIILPIFAERQLSVSVWGMGQPLHNTVKTLTLWLIVGDWIQVMFTCSDKCFTLGGLVDPSAGWTNIVFLLLIH